MKLAEQEAELGKRMEKKQKKARKNAINDRQLEIQNDTLDAAGYPQATMLKASELLAKLRSKGTSKNRPDSDFDSGQLKMGTAVEMEHGLGKEAAKEIAKDHLAELPDYYTRLKKMEAQGEAKKSLLHKLVVLVKAKYLSRKKVNGKWYYKYHSRDFTGKSGEPRGKKPAPKLIGKIWGGGEDTTDEDIEREMKKVGVKLSGPRSQGYYDTATFKGKSVKIDADKFYESVDYMKRVLTELGLKVRKTRFSDLEIEG